VYIVFGEAKIEDIGAQAQASAAQAFRQDLENPVAAAAAPAAKAAVAAKAEEDETVSAEDEAGFSAEDIALIMSQAAVSKAKAIAALKENKGDVVNTIMVRF
jgi:nascent polypeptide-associated complex subunit alpha